jgi:hypothetical protein
VSGAIAAAAMIHEARGERVESDRLSDALMRAAAPVSGRGYGPLIRLLVMRDDVQGAGSLERPPSWRVHTNDVYEGEAELLAGTGDWSHASRLLDAMRSHVTRAGTIALLAFADRLEGRAALAEGNAAHAATSLSAAADRFDELGAPWERALTQVDLARALAARRDRAPADVALRAAAETFEELGAVKDLAAARSGLEDA